MKTSNKLLIGALGVIMVLMLIGTVTIKTKAKQIIKTQNEIVDESNANAEAADSISIQ